MDTPRFTPGFKEEAVRQIAERAIPMSNYLSELGSCTQSLQVVTGHQAR
jgi:hypothetical protein